MLDTPPEIHVRDARLTYAGQPLFDGLSLDLPAGRTTCLLGPSGVGKTSLLRLIANLADAAEGMVSDASGRSLAGRIAYMAQTDLLLPWERLLDNVTIGARLRGERPDRKAARALLARVGLADREADRPAALSGGMRQRAALARTLLENRPVVLMDEPFSALDAVTRLDLQGLAADLLRGRTVLLVTHDPLEALRLGHEVRVMSGRPARLSDAIAPPGLPARDPGESEILRLHGELLHRLIDAADSSAWR